MNTEEEILNRVWTRLESFATKSESSSQTARQPTSQSTYQPPIQCRYNNKPPRLSVFLYFPLGFSPHSGNRGQVQLSIYIYIYIHTRRRFYNAAGAAGVYPIPWLPSRAPSPPSPLPFSGPRAPGFSRISEPETRRPTTPPPPPPLARDVACQPTFIFAPVFDPFHPFDPLVLAELLQLRERCVGATGFLFQRKWIEMERDVQLLPI